MEKLISDLLDAAKVEAGGLTVEFESSRVEPIIRDAIELIAPTARQRGVEIRESLQDGLPEIRMDPSRILQVMGNLLGNALKFTPSGGRVTVEARSQPSEVTITVTDSGSGIPEERMSHLFDRYWQAQETAKQGTGLGLFIVKGIVEAHHGKVWVESRRGSGSKFSFSLPLFRSG